MNNRVSIADLLKVAERISEATGTVYSIESAYGGYKLVREYPNSTGIHNVTGGYIGKKQLLELCDIYLQGYLDGKK